MTKLNKEALVTAIVEAEPTLSRRTASRIVSKMLDTIIATVAAGGEASFIGFGSFKAVDVAKRTGRDPQGKKITVPAHKRVKFTAGKAFKESL